MWKPAPVQRTTMLKRRVGYGEYMDGEPEESEPMEIDKRVETKQKID